MPAGDTRAQARLRERVDDGDAELAAALDDVIPRYTQVLRHAIAQDHGPERLTMPQLRLLQALARTPTGTALTTHLARQMDVTVPTMTSRIDGLVERGFVERRPDPASRRQVQLVLTSAGRAHLERCQALVDERLRGLLSHLSAAQKDRLRIAVQDIAAMLAADAAPRSGATEREEERPW